MTKEQIRRPPALHGDPIGNLVVQADTLAFTLDLAAAFLQNERPHLAAFWRAKAETARAVIRQIREM
jgi:hypothetical protein